MTTNQLESSSPQGTAEHVVVLEGWLPPEAAAYDTSSILYLPFDVPEGVTRIHIRREIEPWEKRTVALLVFDPRGHGPGLPGFRGYQGTVNLDMEIIITGQPETTTPWYTPGKIPAGRWHLGQWYLKPASREVLYRYTITLGFDGPAAPEAELPCSPWPKDIPGTGAGWYAGSLHNHTVYSYDSHLGGEPRTLEQLVAEHRAAGIHFVAVTDHNQPRAHYDLASASAEHPDVLLLAGIEITTIHGHANVIGGEPGGRFEFRMDPGDGQVHGVWEKAREQGALFIINHPFGPCTDCPWKFVEEVWSEADAIEVWNRPWADSNRRAVDAWDALLKTGRRMPATGGTDYHRGENTFAPVTWVHSESLSRNAILEAIRRGRTYVTEGPEGPRLFLSGAEASAVPGDTLKPEDGRVRLSLRVVDGAGLTARIVWNGGEQYVQVNGPDALLRIDVPSVGTTYVRAELQYEDNRVAALTGALYVEV